MHDKQVNGKNANTLSFPPSSSSHSRALAILVLAGLGMPRRGWMTLPVEYIHGAGFTYYSAPGRLNDGFGEVWDVRGWLTLLTAC